MNDYAFGNFLYTLRTEKKLSQTQLAKQLGVTNKAVSKWENGASKPNTALIPRLAEILNVTVEELFAGRRLEKSTELKQLKEHLFEQKKQYAVLSAVFLAITVVLPLLMIEFICVMMFYQIPDDVAGPLGSIGLIVAFVVSLSAFLIYRSNYRHAWAPSDMMLKTGFTKAIQWAFSICVIAWAGLLIGTVGVFHLLRSLFHQEKAACMFLVVAVLVLIFITGTLVSLLRIRRLLNIRLFKPGEKRTPIPFRRWPWWLKICFMAMMVLFPAVFCLWFTEYTIKYAAMLLLLAFGQLPVIYSIIHRR